MSTKINQSVHSQADLLLNCSFLQKANSALRENRGPSAAIPPNSPQQEAITAQVILLSSRLPWLYSPPAMTPSRTGLLATERKEGGKLKLPSNHVDSIHNATARTPAIHVVPIIAIPIDLRMRNSLKNKSEVNTPPLNKKWLMVFPHFQILQI